MEQVSLKSRGSTRRSENTGENLRLSVDLSLDDVMNDVIGSTISAGKYALYRPRPGKNVSTVRRQHGVEAGEENIAEKDASGPFDEDNAGATCPPTSEPSPSYETIDKAVIFICFFCVFFFFC